MSAAHAAVGWNRQKRLYDAIVACGVLSYVAVFYAIGKFAGRGGVPEAVHDDAMLLIRGLGTGGLLMLHIVLWIGPLARLDARLAPLLYNRRHLGVMTFLVGLAHATIALVQYHGFGNLNPLVSLLVSNTRVSSLSQFPFEWLGAGALAILFMMAATSHDFWLNLLSARVWKWLHMSVYGAYVLLVMHVVLGVLQQEFSPVLSTLLIVGVAITVGLHLAAGRRERRRDVQGNACDGGLLDAGPANTIALNRARVVCMGARPDGHEQTDGERIAVFKHERDGRTCVSAVSNVCAHQQGPLGEGKVIDGCITCPWHGYQYRPESGCAPPPFTEKVKTYRVTIRGGRVWVDPRPLPAGTPVEPAVVSTEVGHA